MGRNVESSYKKAVDYMQQVGKAVTVNDMIEANIMSRGTVYKLFRPEMFGTMALYGIYPLNDNKPFFFAHNEEVTMKLIENIDADKAKAIRNTKEVMTAVAQQVASNSTVLNELERAIIKAFRKYRESEPDDAKLLDNFGQPLTIEMFFQQLEYPEVKAVLLSDITKFRTFLISAFVASFNESED